MVRPPARFLVLFLLLAVVHSHGQDAQSDPPGALPKGVAISKLSTLADPQQSYAVYLPSKYSRELHWPIVYVFDALARGPLALAQFQHAAERYGYIVAVSNNSRNGPWPPELKAADAMVRDTQQRFAVDLKRIYFGGFSGGARVAWQLARLCNCAAGVVLSGAGLSHGTSPSAESKFPVFSAVGNADFNYSELIPLQDALERATLPHWLRVFDGPHEWAPPIAMDEALAWFRIQAMKSQREPRDDGFLAVQFDAAKNRALVFEQSGDLLRSWREYRQIAATFNSLLDTAAIDAKAAALEQQKPLREAVKREHSDFEEQERLGNEILAAAGSVQTENRGSARTLTRDLRLRAEHERKPEHVLVLKRALAGVLIGSLESGLDAVDNKDFRRAESYFACAAEANPEAEWAWRNLAVARVSSGDRKGALEALRSARKVSKDLPAFSSWLGQEPAFERLRSSEDFQSLVASVPGAED
jgi:dienelactone hydrolase